MAEPGFKPSRLAPELVLPAIVGVDLRMPTLTTALGAVLGEDMSSVNDQNSWKPFLVACYTTVCGSMKGEWTLESDRPHWRIRSDGLESEYLDWNPDSPIHLAVWPWAGYVTTLCFSFLLCEMRTIQYLPPRLSWGFSRATYAKHLASYLTRTLISYRISGWSIHLAGLQLSCAWSLTTSFSQEWPEDSVR